MYQLHKKSIHKNQVETGSSRSYFPFCYLLSKQITCSRSVNQYCDHPGVALPNTDLLAKSQFLGLLQDSCEKH